jgi:hypothetical protein
VVRFEKRIVYIVRSNRNPERHYTGVTSNTLQRLRWRNTGQNTGRALLEARDSTYQGTPLGWCCHGSVNCDTLLETV